MCAPKEKVALEARHGSGPGERAWAPRLSSSSLGDFFILTTFFNNKNY